MNILRFQPNVPTQVALQSSQGIVVEGRYGNRMMFSLVDGRVMYVPPIVATKIEAEGIAAGERFELCKAQIKNGRGRSVEWALRRLDPEEQLVDVAPDAPAPEPQLEHDLRVSVEMANAKKASTDLPEPPPPAPTPANPTNGNGSETGEKAPASPLPVEAQNGTPQPRSLTKLEHALKTAISAAHNAEKYGSELGYVVRFDADAIKSMAITVLINMSGESRR